MTDCHNEWGNIVGLESRYKKDLKTAKDEILALRLTSISGGITVSVMADAASCQKY